MSRDAARTAILEGAGYRVVRFWNAEVIRNLDGVVETILVRAAESPPTPVRASRDSALPTASGGRAIAALAAAVFSLLAGSALAAQQRQVGSWVLKWGSGNIGSYCTVESVQGGRTLGYQVVKTGQVFFGLRDPDWRWEPKSIHRVRLTVGGQAEWTGRAVSPLPDVLVLPVGQNPSPDPARAMGSGAMLVVEVKGRKTRFDLKDFPEAAKAQRDCLAEPA